MNIVEDQLVKITQLHTKLRQYIPKAEVTLLGIASLTSIQKIKDLDSEDWKDSPMLTLDTWDMLSVEELEGLTKYYLVVVRDSGLPPPTQLEFLAKRTIIEIGGEFIVTRDQAGVSGRTL